MWSPDFISGVSTGIFWFAGLLVVYPYVGYPLILATIRALRTRPDSAVQNRNHAPKVTLIVSAHNEAEVIASKLDNTLALQYPRGRLDVIVISDASDDGTDDIVSDYADRHEHIRLFRQTERLGKTAGINAAMCAIKDEIVVFSDANALYEPEAICELVQPFADPGVGYVVGSALYYDKPEQPAQDSEGLYWKYELMVKQLESDVHSVVGGDGAIYAIRSALFTPLRDSDINDFVNPLQIVAHGFSGVFTHAARCREYAGQDFQHEFRRKRRIVNRSWRAVIQCLPLFARWRHSGFLFMLISHKVVRWLSIPLVLLAIGAGIVRLLNDFSVLYMVLMFLILTTVILASLGFLFDRSGRSMGRAMYLPYYFYAAGIASALGIVDNLRGVKHVTWGHVRGHQ